MPILALSTLDGDFFDLDPKTTLTLTLINPIFDRDAIDRVFTFPFTLPASPTNLDILKHANRLDAAHRGKRLGAILWLEGNPFQYGELEKIKTGARRIEVTFKNTSLRTSEKLRAKKLRSVSHTETVTTAYNPDILLASVWPLLSPITTIAVGINDHIFEKSVADMAGLIADINAVFPGVASDPGLPAGINERWLFFSNIPDPNNFKIYLRPGVTNPAVTAFFAVNATTAEDEAERIETAFDALLAAGGSDLARYPCIKAPNLYGEKKNDLYGGYANYIQGDTQEHPNDATAFLPNPRAWRHTLLPLPHLKPLLDAIAESVGLTGISGSFFADTEVQSLLLWHNTPIDLVVGDLDFIVDRAEDAPDNYLHTYRPIFNLAEFLPDITALDLVQRLVNTFCLFLRTKQGRLIVTPVRDLLRAAPEDWTSISEPYDTQTFPNYEGYTLDYDRQGDETNEPPQLQRVDGGSEAQEFICPIYTLFERVEADQYLLDFTTGIPIRSWRIPYIAEEGRSSYFNLTKPATLRLLWWRGIQEDSEGQDYPLATHGRMGFGGTQVGNYSLDWQGPGGLFETWWQEYIRLITNGRPIIRGVRLSAAQLTDLSQWRSVVKKTVYDELGQTTAVVKSVRVNITQSKIETAKVEFVTL